MSADSPPRAVDRDRVDQRLERIEVLCDALADAAGMNTDEFLDDADAVAATERRLQVAIQASIDVAAHVSAASAWPVAEGYAATFRVLGQRGVLDEPLAERLALAAGLRNLLVHDYLEIDPARLHASLDADLADLRAFVRAVVHWLAGPARAEIDPSGGT